MPVPKDNRGIITILWNLSTVDQVIYTLDTICMPDIMILGQVVLHVVFVFIMLLYYIKRQSRKREIIQPNIYRILPTFNQVIYSFDPICIYI